MKKLLPPVVLGALMLCGCTHHYVMRLTNGMTITTASKPKLKGNTYIFKDGLGRTNYVPQGRVIEVEPASMASDENKAKQFKAPTQALPPTKHWYWPF